MPVRMEGNIFDYATRMDQMGLTGSLYNAFGQHAYSADSNPKDPSAASYATGAFHSANNVWIYAALKRQFIGQTGLLAKGLGKVGIDVMGGINPDTEGMRLLKKSDATKKMADSFKKAATDAGKFDAEAKKVYDRAHRRANKLARGGHKAVYRRNVATAAVRNPAASGLTNTAARVGLHAIGKVFGVLQAYQVGKMAVAPIAEEMRYAFAQGRKHRGGNVFAANSGMVNTQEAHTQRQEALAMLQMLPGHMQRLGTESRMYNS